jgi:ribosomal protein L7/L12
MELLQNTPAAKTGGLITISSVRDSGTSKIPFIKIIREYTGQGLKETKDFCDHFYDLTSHATAMTIRVSNRRECIRELSTIGVSVK